MVTVGDLHLDVFLLQTRQIDSCDETIVTFLAMAGSRLECHHRACRPPQYVVRRRSEAEQTGTSGMRAHHDDIGLVAGGDREDLVACVTFSNQLFDAGCTSRVGSHDTM